MGYDALNRHNRVIKTKISENGWNALQLLSLQQKRRPIQRRARVASCCCIVIKNMYFALYRA